MLGLGNSLVSGTAPEQLYSISFDGSNDHVTLGDVLDLGTTDFSISLWVKLADVTSKYLITKVEDSDNQILIYFSGDKIVANLQGGGDDICTHTGAPNMTALQDTWIHICVTMDRDGDGIKEYRCTASKTNGERCKNKTENKNKKCYAHQ